MAFSARNIPITRAMYGLTAGRSFINKVNAGDKPQGEYEAYYGVTATTYELNAGIYPKIIII
jgi:hypothetical protein